MNTETDAKIKKIEDDLLEVLDGLEKDDRLKIIDDFLHRLNFERRLTMLTEEELAHMNDTTLSPAAKAKVAGVKNEAEREELIKGYARASYFRMCAWADYLNGVSNTKPFTSVKKD